MPENLLTVAYKVIQVLDQLGIPYLICGSLASSVHGMVRSTNDVDILADMRPNDVCRFIEALREEFYIHEDAVTEAVRDGSSFNVIHYETAFKVDIFVAAGSPFGQMQIARAQTATVEGLTICVASAEDTVLAKLLWYRQGGESSVQQWRDVVGIVKVRGADLDREYLRAWASRLGVMDLLERALAQAT